ncbi:MAG: ATPase [Hyphomicrobiales bacterium]|nr:MAG: ATPase [Hyphomicrobiales bacterium]
MTEATITKSAFFAASRETVWAFLTEKDKLGQWFHPAKENMQEGKDYALIHTNEDGTETPQCWGQVLEMDQPNRLVYTFTIKPLGGAMTTVTWTLDACAGGTKLSLKHEGIEAAAGEAALNLLMALDGGWDKHIAGLRAATAA